MTDTDYEDRIDEAPPSTRAVAVARPVENTAVAIWGTNNPREMTARMADVADSIKDVVSSRGLTKRIGDNDYALVEAWNMAGAILGVFPRTVAVEAVEDGVIEAEDIEKRGRNGPWIKHLPRVEGNLTYKAEVELVTRGGEIVGGATSFCSKHEEQWRDRDDNQVASMAQTRATAKSFRQSFGFIMPMAGYAATPAEEMDGIQPSGDGPPARQQASEAVKRPAGRSGDVSRQRNQQKPMDQPQGDGQTLREKSQRWSGLLQDKLKEQELPIGDLEIVFNEKPSIGVIQAYIEKHESEDKPVAVVLDELIAEAKKRNRDMEEILAASRGEEPVDGEFREVANAE